MSRASNLTIADQWTTLIRREDDGETFVAAVLNITSSDMEVILTCKDRDDPKDETEAGAFLLRQTCMLVESLQTRSTKNWETACHRILPVVGFIRTFRGARRKITRCSSR